MLRAVASHHHPLKHIVFKHDGLSLRSATTDYSVTVELATGCLGTYPYGTCIRWLVTALLDAPWVHYSNRAS
jgi:hypothetical protein